MTKQPENGTEPSLIKLLAKEKLEAILIEPGLSQNLEINFIFVCDIQKLLRAFSVSKEKSTSTKSSKI